VATYLFGFDIGSSGAAAMLLDLAGNPLVGAYREYPCTSLDRDGSSRTRTTRWRPPRTLLPRERLLSTENWQQRFTPTANLMIRIKVKNFKNSFDKWS
jgi:hypothetical protein